MQHSCLFTSRQTAAQVNKTSQERTYIYQTVLPIEIRAPETI